MSIYYLRKYPTEWDMVVLFDFSRDTISHWLWYYLRAIQALKDDKIYWPEEWDPNIPDNPFIPYHLFSVDGTHCRVMERTTASRSKDTTYYSHKFSGPGLTYEVAMNIWECNITSSQKGTISTILLHSIYSHPAWTQRTLQEPNH
jgi:hypothetical protein